MSNATLLDEENSKHHIAQLPGLEADVRLVQTIAFGGGVGTGQVRQRHASDG